MVAHDTLRGIGFWTQKLIESAVMIAWQPLESGGVDLPWLTPASPLERYRATPASSGVTVRRD